ncbi:MAG: DNA translocase FtsK 4TM domain-containing protein [Candidatus Paceibacterota bacterium]|jgi:S-DNA-T family DNA segregation ATPase FtsK/SpoIIIE
MALNNNERNGQGPKRKRGRPENKNSLQKPRTEYLKAETKRAILAVLCFALAIFFILAKFNTGGPAGQLTYQILDKLFGAGFLLIPIILLFWGVILLRSIKVGLVATRAISGFFFLIAVLGMASILFKPETGGLVGLLISTPLLNYFAYYASLVFLGAIILVSLIVAFDTHKILGIALWRKIFYRSSTGESAKEILSKEKELKINGENAGEKETAEKSVETNKKDEDKNRENIKDKNGDSLLGVFPFFGRKSKTGAFVPPPISLLEQDSGKPNAGDIKANANIIKRTLANFGIPVEMDEVSIGPTVTRYALKPAEGVKLSRIVALQNDLSLSLAAHPLRIEAPIPGKSLVGIEVPNKVKAIIRLASLLSTVEYLESHHPLFAALGRDITGAPRYANLAKAPHMLIAGATGSGKSVTIHAIINSLLYRNPPDQLRFIMIDPKRVELTLYNRIPHLLTPVITDPKKAIAALRWLAKEMDRRYDILEAEAVRDIQSYHKNILAKTAASTTKKTEGDEIDQVETMPYIIVIIDELADIMTSYPRELEAAIVRLAQMSRAVGIHLLLSTQRPSVEVITGLIKANIPSRIAMQVASQIDSRTILDAAGAEKLLGAGDMLYISGEMSKPVRLQSSFITEEELKKVVNYLADQYADNLPSDLNLSAEEAIASGSGSVGNGKALFTEDFGDNGADDDLYEDARAAVMEAGKASASYLQRKLKVGYARAARLLDMLEEHGVIGAGSGAKPREVYGAQIDKETNGVNNFAP